MDSRAKQNSQHGLVKLNSNHFVALVDNVVSWFRSKWLVKKGGACILLDQEALSSVLFKNLRKQNRSILDSENRMTPLYIE
jgi:hypothetical protein